MPRTRAWRRWRRRVAEAHARRVASRRIPSDPAAAKGWAKRNRDNLCKCSCPMCGHARRYGGTTPAERRAADAMIEQLRE